MSVSDSAIKQVQPVLCVTPNPVLDLTVAVNEHAALEDRGTVLAETAGGKGVNVARFLIGLGVPAIATGLLGGWTGGRISDLLDQNGVPHDMIHIAGQTRYSFNIVDRATGKRDNSLDFRGPHVDSHEAERLVEVVRTRAAHAAWVIIAGSLPPGLHPSIMNSLLRACGNTPVVLDANDSVLREGLKDAPRLVKINRGELASAGYPDALRSLTAARQAITDLRSRFGIPEAWITLGSGGVLVQTDDGTLRVSVGIVANARNSSSAGDCFLAALIAARAQGLSLEEQARFATAQATASVELSTPTLAHASRVEHLLKLTTVQSLAD